MSANDVLLIERWRQRGDAEAFAEIVSHYSGMVYATCRRVLRDSEDAQDAAQECFIELMRARLEPSSPLGPWLHTVAVRRSLDHFKRARRRVQRELDHPQAQETVQAEPETAELLAVIDEAIADVSTARAQLGAIQKYTLETKINSLNVALENVTASESRIRDVDMAAEMATFTKNQVLVQSATAMLAQANAQPQSILSLLQ